MPDWLIILVKCVLWWLFVCHSYTVLARVWRRLLSAGVSLEVAAAAAVILAALNGWITP